MSTTTAASTATSAAVSAIKAANPTVYLFRHIQTSQVLVSLKPEIERQSLKQIANVTRRPPHVRRDHWHPMVAIQGFKTQDQALSFHNSLRDGQLNLTAEKTVEKQSEYMLQPRRLRKVQEMDQVQETLGKMTELLNSKKQFVNNQGEGIKILWERPGLRAMVEEELKLKFLEKIQHEELIVKRGNTIVNA